MAADLPLNNTQLDQIQTLLESKKSEFVGEATASLTSAFDAGLKSAVNEAVTQAVGSTNGLVIARFESKSGEDKKHRYWEITLLVLPVVLTISLGGLVWYWQHGVEERSKAAQQKVEEKVDQNTKFLEAQLAIRQEYFKRKMDVFQEIWKQMALVYADSSTAHINSKGTTQAINSLTKLSNLVDSNQLYISEKTRTSLREFWEAANDFSTRNAVRSVLDEKQKKAEACVFEELRLVEMNAPIQPSP